MECFKKEKDIQNFIKELGGTFVGFSNVYDKLPDALKKYQYAITVGIRLSDAIFNEMNIIPTFTYFHHYRTVNSLIDYITLRVTLFLQDNGYMAYAIPASQSIPDATIAYSGVFSHKTGAVKAGLGWMGKSGLFISKEYGPSVRLGTILTDMEFEMNNNVLDSRCGECRKCVDSCPAKALTGESWDEFNVREKVVDPKACSDYMKANFRHIGRGSVCGICISVCPFRKNK